jgi:hypothetical protein
MYAYFKSIRRSGVFKGEIRPIVIKSPEEFQRQVIKSERDANIACGDESKQKAIFSHEKKSWREMFVDNINTCGPQWCSRSMTPT